MNTKPRVRKSQGAVITELLAGQMDAIERDVRDIRVEVGEAKQDINTKHEKVIDKINNHQKINTQQHNDGLTAIIKIEHKVESLETKLSLEYQLATLLTKHSKKVVFIILCLVGLESQETILKLLGM